MPGNIRSRFLHAKTVGIVTAPTGAAIRDIMNIAARRNPYVQLILYPAQVQGTGAKESIVRGIRALEAYGVDVMIVGRGGGSIEDLWAFNEEEVARAIFNCRIPVISAVGHETDTTIADYVADLRAPTPSAAAELAVSDYRQTKELLREYERKMSRMLEQQIRIKKLKLQEFQTKLGFLHPRYRLQERQQRLVDLEDRLRLLMERRMQMARHKMALYAERMKGLSPLEKLSQGYSYVAGEDGKAVKSITQIRPKQELSIYVTDGVIRASVREIREEEHG